MNYLVVVAHPDDEVLGAGATIHKLISEGHNVAVAIMVSQAAARKGLSSTLSDDEAKALSIIGVKKTYHASFPTIKMHTVSHLELVQFVESCIEDWNAEVIITHHPSDTNNDHIQTSYAVQAACRLFQRRDNLPALKEVLYMEVLSSTEWSLDTSANRFTPNYFVEVGKEGVELKLKALSEYKGVMRPYPHPRSNKALEGLAAYRGVQAGCNYAEAFE
uniref:PIG-L deacetylase family protein n=1 Tax=Catenibacterium sp. TaxID=2049022 RepID=UPI003FD71925